MKIYAIQSPKVAKWLQRSSSNSTYNPDWEWMVVNFAIWSPLFPDWKKVWSESDTQKFKFEIHTDIHGDQKWLQICRNYKLQSSWTLKSTRIDNFMSNSLLK